MPRIKSNQRGYVGFSRSVRAAEAERDGRLPLTRAAQALAADVGCTVRTARTVLEELGACEWHHVSKYANAVDFYEVGDEARELAEERTPLAEREKRLAAAQRRNTQAAWLAALAAREERQLAEARVETGRRLAREFAASAAEAALVRQAAQEYELEQLKAAFRRAPSAGRAQALRERGVDPASV